MKKQALMELLGSLPVKPKSISITKVTVIKKKKPTDASAPEEPKAPEPNKENMEQTSICPMGDKKVASAQQLIDAYFEGFVKECEARGVDSEKLVAILLNHEKEI